MTPGAVILIILAALILLFAAGSFFCCLKFYNIAMNRNYRKGRVSSRARQLDPDHPLKNNNDFRKEWFAGMNAGQIFMRSRNGLKLASLIKENEESANRRFAVLLHGYTGYPEEMGYAAERFYERGYSILAPAARAHGASEGSIIGMGWQERLDILDWISLLNEKYDNPDIVLYGVSMGGATVMMTAGEDLPSNVRCAIEDCGYSSVREQYRHSLINMMKLPSFLMLFVDICVFFVTGMNLHRDGIVSEQLRNCRVPMFFAHGTDDRYVPFRMLEENYSAHPGPKEKMAVEGALHIDCPWTGGSEYWDRIIHFISLYTD